MLFNSFEFIFLFLPVTLGVFFWLTGRAKSTPALYWLIGCAFFFYAYWNVGYGLLLIASVSFNYILGIALAGAQSGRRLAAGRVCLLLGVIFNLGLIAYFKYFGFMAQNINAAFHLDWPVMSFLLPLGISFFTFQQLAYIVDIYRGAPAQGNFLKYFLFIGFFPHLLAGPILHPREIFPQFDRNLLRPLVSRNFAIGLTIFTVGLFKKVVLADGVAGYAGPVFEAAANGAHLTCLEAWAGALAYTFQLYFDFSGYSDMATGLARLFGIKFPLNFYSPYKAVSIIDFWRRWHMTLSRFLRDYVYIPLGGNQKGRVRRYVNLMATMFLGGLWHGAAWTFVIWGVLHGVLLTVNHLWRSLLESQGWGRVFKRTVYLRLGTALTFVCVVAGWVIFRADSVTSARRILTSMANWNDIVLPATLLKYVEKLPGAQAWFMAHGLEFRELSYFKNMSEGLVLLILLLLVMKAPNTAQIMQRFSPVLKSDAGFARDRAPAWLIWRPAKGWAYVIAFLFVYAVLGLSRTSQFLYFNF
jgi:alginate O-acetyltransferase complex protein AlgI